MNKVYFFIVSLFLLTSCALTKKEYVYDFDLIKPKYSEDFKFSDSLIDVEFSTRTSNIDFKLKNVSNKSIKLIWDDFSFVNEKGAAQKIIHKNIKLNNKEGAQAPTVIPTNSYIEDTVTPIDDIEFVGSKNYGGLYTSPVYWKKAYIFPKLLYGYSKQKDLAKSLVGNNYSLLMVIEKDNTKIEYKFDFKINDITLQIKKNNEVIKKQSVKDL